MVYNHRPTPIHLQQNFFNDMILSNELQYAISVVSVVQTSTSQMPKEFEFRSLLKELNIYETSGVRTPNLDMFPFKPVTPVFCKKINW
jgi:hypothetical protein